MKKINPELIMNAHPDQTTLDPRNDVKRSMISESARQCRMRWNLPTIAKTYYGGAVEPYPSSITSRYMKGWAWPFEKWPKDLQEEYTYIPPKLNKCCRGRLSPWVQDQYCSGYCRDRN